MASLLPPQPEALEKLSFIVSSGQRQKVLAAVLPSAKTPAQLAKETGLRLPHVSRALSQLAAQGLVTTLSSSVRGRLYGATELGKAVFDEFTSTRGDRIVAPLGRGTHFKNYHHWLVRHYGKKAADDLFASLGVDPRRVNAAGWYPLGTIIHTVDMIESTFGDGTGETVRRMLREEAQNFASVKRYLGLALPFKYLAEMMPAAYHREFNHGRLEVEVHGRRALVKNYDWISSPARCAAWRGTYEGALHASGYKKAIVTKVACILKGDPYCGYVMEW